MVNIKEAEKLLEAFKSLKVMVIGDVMLDNYLIGAVERISPEAPIPVVSVRQKESRLGGAANVARNLQALGATPLLCAVIGQDENGHQLLDLLHEELLGTEGIVTSPYRPTTVKTRVISNNQQLIRFDEEVTFNLNELIEQEFLGQILLLFKSLKPDAVIFQDYDKGTITPVIIEGITEVCHQYKVPVFVDPKKKNFNRYNKASLFKPNLKEMKEGINSDVIPENAENLFETCHVFMKKHKIEQMIVTLGAKGMFACNQKEHFIIPAKPRAISDVSGAGDTVIATVALCQAAGVDLKTSAELANLAGGLVCEKPGVVAIQPEDLIRELQES